MSLVKLKQKGQMTLPAEIRHKLGLDQGDVLEAQVQRGRIVLSPKAVVDRDWEAGFERMEELGDRIRERLAKEGKTEDDLQELIEETVEEVRAERYAARKQKH